MIAKILKKTRLLMNWTSRYKIFYSHSKILLPQYPQGNHILKWRLKILYNNKLWFWIKRKTNIFNNQISEITWYKKRLKIEEFLSSYMIKIMKISLIIKDQWQPCHSKIEIWKTSVSKIVFNKIHMNTHSAKNIEKLIGCKTHI